MSGIYSINDLLNYERDEFSLVDEQIVVWKPHIRLYQGYHKQLIDIEKTRERARKWVMKNAVHQRSETDIEKDTDMIMRWIKNYYAY